MIEKIVNWKCSVSELENIKPVSNVQKTASPIAVQRNLSKVKILRSNQYCSDAYVDRYIQLTFLSDTK